MPSLSVYIWTTKKIWEIFLYYEWNIFVVKPSYNMYISPHSVNEKEIFFV